MLTLNIEMNSMNSNQIKCWFLRRGANRTTWTKTSQSRTRVENQQTQLTYDAESRNRTRTTLAGSGALAPHLPPPSPPKKHNTPVFSRAIYLFGTKCRCISSLSQTFGSLCNIFLRNKKKNICKEVAMEVVDSTISQFGVSKNTCARRDKIKYILKIQEIFNGNICNQFP